MSIHGAMSPQSSQVHATYTSIHSLAPSGLASGIKSPKKGLQESCAKQVAARNPKPANTGPSMPEDSFGSPPDSRRMRTAGRSGHALRSTSAPRRGTFEQGKSQAQGHISDEVPQVEWAAVTTDVSPFGDPIHLRQQMDEVPPAGSILLISEGDMSSGSSGGSANHVFRNAMQDAKGFDEGCRRDLFRFLQACEVSTQNLTEAAQHSMQSHGNLRHADKSAFVPWELPPTSSDNLLSPVESQAHSLSPSDLPQACHETELPTKLQLPTSVDNPMEFKDKSSGYDETWLPGETAEKSWASPLPIQDPICPEAESPVKLQVRYANAAEQQRCSLIHQKSLQAGVHPGSPLKLQGPTNSISFSSPGVTISARDRGIPSDMAPRFRNLPPLPTPADTPVRQSLCCLDGASETSTPLSGIWGLMSPIGSPLVPSDSFSLSSGTRTLAEAREQFKASLGGPERSAEFSRSVIDRLEMACGDLGNMMAAAGSSSVGSI